MIIEEDIVVIILEKKKEMKKCIFPYLVKMDVGVFKF